MKKRTGASGDHFHIGKDKKAKEHLRTIFAQEGAKLDLYEENMTMTDAARRNRAMPSGAFMGANIDGTLYYPEELPPAIVAAKATAKARNRAQANPFMNLISNGISDFGSKYVLPAIYGLGAAITGAPYAKYLVSNPESAIGTAIVAGSAPSAYKSRKRRDREIEYN